MTTRRTRTIGIAWWAMGLSLAAASVVMASSCAKGTELDASSGGAGGAGGSAAPSSAAHGTSSSSAATGTSSASSSSSATGGTASSSSAAAAASSSSGLSCNFQEHICNGMCVGNTIDTGCYLSVACAPCPMPTHGIATCSASGTCGVQCDMGYTPNATMTDCDPIPPPPMCCNDSDCALFTICLDGYCRNPLASACDPARCNEFCKCTMGGTPNATGMCHLNVFVWECLCTP